MADAEFFYRKNPGPDPDPDSALWAAMIFDSVKGDGTRPITGVAPRVFIRARQGHSVNAEPTSLYITKITAAEAEGLNPVVHSTSRQNQFRIGSQGLIPGGVSGSAVRAAVQFLACGLARDRKSEAAMSSLRQHGDLEGFHHRWR